MDAPSRAGVARTLDTRPTGRIPTPWRALNRPAMTFREPSRLRIVSILRVVTRLPPSRLRLEVLPSSEVCSGAGGSQPEEWRQSAADFAWRCYLPQLGTKDLESSPHPGVSPDRAPTQYGQMVRLVSFGKRLGLKSFSSLWYRNLPTKSTSKLGASKPWSLNSISAETDYILSLCWAHCHLVDGLYPLGGELAAD